MEKFQADPQKDIVNEGYKGPSAAIEAFGHGAVEHLLFAVSGLVTAGALAYIFHRPAASLVDSARALGSRLKASSNASSTLLDRSKGTVKEWFGGFLHTVFGDAEAAQTLHVLEGSVTNPKHAEWLANLAADKRQGFGNSFLSHTVGMLPIVGKPFKTMLREVSPRTSNAIAVGGLAGVSGYIGGWVKAALFGAVHGNTGKRQFERAKAEIKDLRETNDDLEKINDVLHAKYVEAATSLNDFRTTKEMEEGKLRVSSDEQPAIAKHIAEADAAPAHLQASSTVHSATHQGAVNELVAATQATLA